MHQRLFLKHVYTEVFIVGFDTGRHQRIEIHTEPFDVMESLNPKSIDNSKDIKVVHGYLLPATILPSNLNGIGGFVVIALPNTDLGLFSGEALCNPKDLAITIQTIVTCKKIEIENIFILYGTKINLTLSISEDELDEELIERGCAIVEEVKQIEKGMGTLYGKEYDDKT